MITLLRVQAKTWTAARRLCKEAITKYLGNNAPDRFDRKREKVEREYKFHLDRCGVSNAIDTALQSDYVPYLDTFEDDDDMDNDDNIDDEDDY